MTLAEASAVLEDSLQAPKDENSSEEYAGCPFYYVTPHSAPAGVSFMVSDDTIVRVDIDSAGVRTSDGLEVGSTQVEILRRYGTNVDVDSDLGGDPLLILTSDEPERRFLIIFKTDGKRVTSYRAGRRMAAQVEECA